MKTLTGFTVKTILLAAAAVAAILFAAGPHGVKSTAAASSSMAAAPRPAHADDDGDLKYQWEDPAHSTEELRQMIGAGAILFYAGYASMIRSRRIKGLAR